MKKILIAIDVAREQGNDTVMKTARDIAGAIGGQLVLLYALEPTPGYIASQIPSEALAKRKTGAEKALRELAARYEIAAAVLRDGAAATEILEYASEIGAELIMLHSHDPGLADYFIGSVASRVVRHAHCSVYVVRHPPVPAVD